MAQEIIPPSKPGRKPHQRSEAVAKQIVELAGRGMTQKNIADFLNATVDDGQGYSKETLKRHYRRELDLGLLRMRDRLLQTANERALGENVPDGVSKDVQYREQGRSLEWLLSAVHGISPKTPVEFSGPNGEKAEIDLSLLSDDELDFLNRLGQRFGISGAVREGGGGAGAPEA